MGFTTTLLASSLASSRRTAARRRSYQRMRNYNNLYKKMSLQKEKSEKTEITRQEFYTELIAFLEQIKNSYTELSIEKEKILDEKKAELEEKLKDSFLEIPELQKLLDKRLIKLTTDSYGLNILFDGLKIPSYLANNRSIYDINNWDFNTLGNKKTEYEDRIESISSNITKLEKRLKFKIFKRDDLKYEIMSNKNVLEKLVNEYKSFLNEYEVFIKLRALSNEERQLLERFLKFTEEKEFIMSIIKEIERNKEELLKNNYSDEDTIELAFKKVIQNKESLPTSIEKIIFLVKLYLSEELYAYSKIERLPISSDLVYTINMLFQKNYGELSEKIKRMIEKEEYEIDSEENYTLK